MVQVCLRLKVGVIRWIEWTYVQYVVNLENFAQRQSVAFALPSTTPIERK